jgi:hypothetical protein
MKNTIAFRINRVYNCPTFILDGLIRSPIYVVVDPKRRFAVPHVLPNRLFRHCAKYIELFTSPSR